MAYIRISHEYSSLFIIVINLIFMFSLWCIDWVGSLYGTEFLCVSVLRVASGSRVKLASCKSALKPTSLYALTPPPHLLPPSPPPPPPPPPPVVYSTDRSKAVVPVLVLLFVALWFYSTRRFVVCLSVCHFVLVFFSPFSIAITSLGEERANLSAFRTFVRFVLVWICRFPFPVWFWEGLRFVIVSLPGLFSYLFLGR